MSACVYVCIYVEVKSPWDEIP